MTASRQDCRRGRTVLLLTVLAGVLLIGTPRPALAHDGLVGTAPAAGTTVPAPPATVELEFTGAPLPLGTLVQVTDAAGAVVSEGEPEIRGTTVVQALAGELPAGGYQVRWRSTSSDGHALTGSFDFVVAAASTPAPEPSVPAAPAPVAPSPAAAAQDADPAAGGTPVAGVWIAVGAVVLVGLGVLLAGRQRGRR